MPHSISVKDLAKQLAADPKIELLDVRRKTDYEQSPQKIKGARWVDPEALAEWMGTVPNNQDVVVYCVKGGSVSQSVTETLVGRGCRVKYLDGGIKAWREGGGMVE